MYAQRFSDGPRFRPASLGAAIAINGAFVAALLLANPEWVPSIPKKPMTIIEVQPERIPPPDPKPVERVVKPQPRPTTVPFTPDPIIKRTDVTDNWAKGEEVIREPSGPISGTGDEAVVNPPPPIPPLFVAAVQDPRYLADFQPAYPDFERDAGREGIVKLRIRIGTDGRVKQVERIDGRDSFARASIAHALVKWRFKPATRGGVPEESWKIMTVRFTLNS